MKETREEKAKKFMTIYKCSYEEALQLVLDDEETDKGKLHDWNLSKAQEKELRKVRQAERKKDNQPKEKVKRERKADDEKRELITMIAQMLNQKEKSNNINITNQEREIEFSYNNRKFKITLSAPRK